MNEKYVEVKESIHQNCNYSKFIKNKGSQYSKSCFNRTIKLSIRTEFKSYSIFSCCPYFVLLWIHQGWICIWKDRSFPVWQHYWRMQRLSSLVMISCWRCYHGCNIAWRITKIWFVFYQICFEKLLLSQNILTYDNTARNSTNLWRLLDMCWGFDEIFNKFKSKF